MINKVLSGRYKITERIGIGGMAEVYMAQDTVLGRLVAVKIMLPQYAADQEFTARFRQEAAAAANLQSPYIVNIYDWGQDQGTYYIVMEYVHGSDLKAGIKERGAINQRKVAEIGVQVCSALQVAHNLDITHRDIKPQNIMVQPDGNIKVMDFGIAMAKNSVMTQTSSVLGTAHYISPEQAQGKNLGAASDIYSLGIVLYEAATGHLPFDGPDAVSVALKQVNETPLPPRKINPSIDPALEAIILKAMAKDSRERFATAADMRAALNDFLQGKHVLERNEPHADRTVVMGAAGAVGAASAGAARVGGHGRIAADGTAVMPSVNDSGRQRVMRSNPANSGDVRGARGIDGRGRQLNMPPEKKSKKPLVIGIIAAIAAIIVGVVLFNVFGGSTVPDVTGKTQTQAANILEKAGFTVGDITQDYSADVESGKVISTNPPANTKVDKGTEIDIIVSKGTEITTVPSILGKTNTEAITLLEAAGFKAQAGDPEYSTDYEIDTVMKQSPSASSKAAKGSTVIYNLSKGTEVVSVPDVTGKTQSEAVSTLTAAGFVTVINTEHSDTVDSGKVIRQSPASGKENKGTTVYVYVSSGPDTATVPSNITDMTGDQAANTLSGLGFTNITNNAKANKVTSCTANGSSCIGQSIAKSTTITLS